MFAEGELSRLYATVGHLPGDRRIVKISRFRGNDSVHIDIMHKSHKINWLNY